MKTLEIFDPAMCCSTGVCGPAVDPDLARFAADLDWLKSQGVSVTRYNLAQEPQVFAQHAAVTKALQEGGPECLPLVLADGQLRSMAAYPSRDKLAQWAGLPSGGESAAPAAPTPAGGCGCGPKGCC